MAWRALEHIGLLSLAAISLTTCGDSGIYTLYRSSLVLGGTSVHVATFDTGEGEQYNAENCDIARTLFQSQPGVTVTYWCAKGRFRP